MENAQTQYIGARYVTKIYENSQNPNSAEWEADTMYEPLTMVTYQNGSYLSKKQIPATVGNPAANGIYWVQTGFYNGQIANLQHQIDAINLTISDIEGDIEDVVESIQNITNALNKKDNISIGEIDFTRYHYNQYLIDVIKIPKTKADGSGKNIPITKGTNSAHKMNHYAKDTKIAINGGYGDGYGNTIGSLLVNDVYYAGDILTDPDTCYLAIDEDGNFAYFDYTTDLTTLPALGYHYAIACRCPLIENGAISPNNPLNRFMQQCIGYDNNNYYIINASHQCTLDNTAFCNWILTNIPTIETVFAMDSGGSAQTYINGVMTNLQSDIQHDGLGRVVMASIVFPLDAPVSDNETLGGIMAMIQNNNAAKLLFNLGASPDVTVGTNITASSSYAYKIGNMVIGQLNLIATSSYDGSWTDLTYFNTLLPKSAVNLQMNGVSYRSTSPASAVLQLLADNSQTSVNSNLKFRAESTGTDMGYSFNFVYMTNQNL